MFDPCGDRETTLSCSDTCRFYLDEVCECVRGCLRVLCGESMDGCRGESRQERIAAVDERRGRHEALIILSQKMLNV